MKKYSAWKGHFYKGTAVTKVMLTELIKRKDKLDKLEKAKTLWLLILLFYSALFLFFGVRTLSDLELSLHTNLLTALVNETSLLVFLLLFFVGFFRFRFLAKKEKKAEKEYESLREELIERSGDLWENDPEWTDRQKVFSYMNDKHGINLYHK